MRSFVAVLVASLALTVFSCASDDAASTGADGGGASGRCCPADLTPGCCMAFGGWSAGGDCSIACDGMPLPTDPGWAKSKDSHGCDLWANASGASGAGASKVPVCGGAVRDSSVPDTYQPPPPPPKDSSVPDTSVPDSASPSDASAGG